MLVHDKCWPGKCSLVCLKCWPLVNESVKHDTIVKTWDNKMGFKKDRKMLNNYVIVINLLDFAS